MRYCLMIVAVLWATTTIQAAEPAWDGSWFSSHAGGSTVQLPTFLEEARDFMENGESFGTEFLPIGDTTSFWVQQYRAPDGGDRPYVYLSEKLTGSLATITYSVDKDSVGVISGYADDKLQRVTYDICKSDPPQLKCLSMGWETRDHNFTAPLVEHIVPTFRVD